MFAPLRTAADCLLIPGLQSPSSSIHTQVLTPRHVIQNYTQYLEQAFAFAFLSKLSPLLTLKIFLYPATHDFISYILYLISNNSQFVNQLKTKYY